MLLHEEEAEEEGRICENHVYLYFIPHVIFSSHFLHAVTFFYLFSTLMSLEDRLRLKLKVKTEISLCMAIMLDHPWQYTVLCDISVYLLHVTKYILTDS